ncbi:MAG: sulfatase-like hydrolase/transferase, partial [Polyangiaceae bacterium]|nr:sulfatase-like hydrolase/transferase [Polyangiaceae bacterium]
MSILERFKVSFYPSSWPCGESLATGRLLRPIFTSLAVASVLTMGACDSAPKDKPQESAPVQVAPAEPKAPEPPPEEPKLTRPAEPLNVILLTVDALRSDMPWQGYEKEIAPHLTQLAKEGTVYENHRSTSSYTAQTVATLMTGQFASTLYRTGVFFTNYFDSNEWMTESMQSKGIRTMAVHAHLYFDRAPGLKQGFDIWKMVPGLTWNSQTDESVTSEKSVKAIIELLSEKKNTEGQFFLWSHFMDPHDKYVKHDDAPDFGKKNRGRYDSEVWHTDKWLGELFDFIDQQPWASKTAIVVSADHGEAFGEHDMYKHAFEIWDVLTRVPLIIKAPGADPQRIKAARTHIDVAPTIVDLMGMEALEGFQGASLVPEVYGAEEPGNREPILLELAEDTNNPHRRAIVVGDWKLIVFESGWKKMLFNLKDDPGELKDLAKKEPEKLAE